jgi:hypothetical protein
VLSNRLGLLLGWPVIYREDFRLAAAATLGRSELEPRGSEARAAVESFYRELGRLVASTSVIADSTFPSGVCESDLASLMAMSDLGLFIAPCLARSQWSDVPRGPTLRPSWLS